MNTQNEVSVNLNIQGRIQGDGKWHFRARDEYGMTGYSGPRNSPEAGLKRSVQNYLHQARGKLV